MKYVYIFIGKRSISFGTCKYFIDKTCSEIFLPLYGVAEKIRLNCILKINLRAFNIGLE
jgi:hypothetical protein